jgi:hypothetical protein
MNAIRKPKASGIIFASTINLDRLIRLVRSFIRILTQRAFANHSVRIKIASETIALAIPLKYL